MDKDMSELKECPICESKEIVTVYDTWYSIFCTKCGQYSPKVKNNE